MNKAFFAGLVTLAMTGVSGIIAHCAPAFPPEGVAKPNIVFFIADDLSIRDTSVYGSSDVRTPNMERLSAAGMTFDRAFVASPSCAPSRAAFLTGLMPARNGAEPNHSKPRPDIKVLPAYLHEQGYEVVAIGKVGHYDFVKDYGFDYVSNYTFHDDNAIPAAIKWLNGRTSKKPLAFFVGTNWPHVPWPKQGVGNPTDVRLSPALVDTPATRQWRTRYYAAVSRFDTELGEVYDAARAKLGPNTFFIQSSDHGAQWPFGKWNLYDEGIHVPLIVSWPGVIKPKTRPKAMVSWVDILPTLIEVAGGKVPRELDGRSFLPVLRGQTQTHRDRIFTTHSGDGNMNVYPMRSVRTDKWKYILNLHPEFDYTTHIDRNADGDANSYWDSWEISAKTNAQASAIINRYHERPADELYDLDADPNELHSLAALPAYGQTKANLRRELDDWMKAEGDKQTVYGKPRLLNAPDAVETPHIVGKELTVTCKVTPDSPAADGVIVAQGGNRQGYALYLDAGKPIFVVRQQGQLYTAAATDVPSGTFSVEAHLEKDGAITLAINGTIVARGKAPGLFAAQPAEELSVGDDTFVAVGDYKVPNPFKGKIEALQVNAQSGEDEPAMD